MISSSITRTFQEQGDLNDEIKPGDWVLVMYEGNLYPGQVLSIVDHEYKISAMEKCGQFWRWPERPDEIFYCKEKISKKIQPPEVVNYKGHCQFQDM